MMSETAAFQGEIGAYSEEAAHVLFPLATTVPQRSLSDVFAAVETGEVDRAAVPVENSQAGSINDVYDLLLQHKGRVIVTGDYMLRVRHMLLALPSETLESIHTVRSHPQALAQTDAFCRAQGLRIEPSYDTAGAARQIAVEGLRGVAAVAGRAAAVAYGLQILAEGIETSDDNYTRFLSLAREACTPPYTKSSLAISMDNRPGALYRALEPFARHDLNLTTLQSRPSRERPWAYVFYLDVEGDASSGPLREALREVEEQGATVALLGSYSTLLETS